LLFIRLLPTERRRSKSPPATRPGLSEIHLRQVRMLDPSSSTPTFFRTVETHSPESENLGHQLIQVRPDSNHIATNADGIFLERPERDKSLRRFPSKKVIWPL